jgi:hypothetical protein
LNVPLQGPQLPFLISPRKRLAQKRKQRLGLQRRISLEMFLNPGPIEAKRIFPRAMGARFLHLTRQRASALVLTHRALTHTCSRCRQLLARSFPPFFPQQFDFSVLFHAGSGREPHDSDGRNLNRSAVENRQI